MADARTPTAHAASHGAAGSDPGTFTEAQVTGLATDLQNLANSTAAAQATADYQMTTAPEWGLLLSQNSDPLKFDIGIGVANFIDRYTTPGTTTKTRLTRPAGILGITPAWGSGGRHPLYISLDVTGNVLQSTSAPSLADYTRYSYLGIVVVTPGSPNVINAIYPYASYGGDIVARFIQLCKCLGSFNVSGNVLSPSVGTPTLRMQRSAGQIFRIGSNMANDLRVPDAPLTDHEPEVSFLRAYHSSGSWTYVPATDLDPEYYDNLTGLTAMTSGYFQCKPVFYSPTTTVIQYGQAQYPTLVQAQAHVNDAIAEHPILVGGDFVFRGWWIVQQGCTDINNAAQAAFVERSGVAGAAGASSGGEANTTTNEGLVGVGLALAKSGINLPFKNLESGSGITVEDDAPNKAVRIRYSGSTGFSDLTGAPGDNTSLSSALSGKVGTGRKVNGQDMTADIVLTYSDVGADASGAAATVQGNLASHAGGTGASVHGLGSASTHSASDFDAAGAAAAITLSGLGGAPAADGVSQSTQDALADGTTYKRFSATEKTKLAGIAAGAEVNVNADWNAGSGDAQILNKPTLGSAAAAATTDFATAAKGVTGGDTHDHSGGDGAQIAYSSLSGAPTLGTAAAKNVPATGNAGPTEVVLGNDTRLPGGGGGVNLATALALSIVFGG
jgi:hypothetical protein